MRLIFCFILALCTLNAREIVFGVVPQQSPMKLRKEWMPIAEYLGNACGCTVRFKTEPSITAFEEGLREGRYDMAYMSPYHYVWAHEKQGYDAIVRNSKMLRGILVVRKEGGVNEIADLRGKTILFPAPFAFAATLVTKYELKKKFNIDPEKEMMIRYVNSHDSVYKGVARKVGDVGGGIERTFANLTDTEAKEKLTVLYTTDAYPSHPIAVQRRLPEALRDKLEAAWLAIPEVLIEGLRFKKIVPTDDAEYDVVRSLFMVLTPKDAGK